MSAVWPEPEDMLKLFGQWTGPQTRVRDAGILVAVVARARGAFMGRPVYHTRLDQAAALMHGIECWRPLTFWNSGLAWGSAIWLLELAGFRLAMPVKEQMLLTVDLSDGHVDSVRAVAERLAPYLRPAR